MLPYAQVQMFGDKDEYDDKEADWFEEVEQADVDLGRELKDIEDYVAEYD